MRTLFFALLLPASVLACSSGGSDPAPASSASTSDGGATTTSPASPGSEDEDADGGGATRSDGGGGGTTKASGLEGFCEHYFECGGGYYADVKDCIDASEGYWGACRRPELDAFGDCMMKVACKDWSPDAYNPASTPCADAWKAVGAKKCP
jgi:hypothetical protein